MKILAVLLCFVMGCATAAKEVFVKPLPRETVLPKPAVVASVQEPQREIKPVPVETGVQQVRSKIRDDVVAFRDLQLVDFTGDGKKEIVAVYSAKKNTSGVKVIKFDGSTAEIMYVNIFTAPNTKFEVKKGIPTISLEELDPVSGLRLKRIYCWDGKTFRQEKRQPGIFSKNR